MKGNKIGTLFLVSVLALAGVGISFAGLTDNILVYGTVQNATVDLVVHNYSGTWVWKVWGCMEPPPMPDIGDFDPDGEIYVFRGFESDIPDVAALFPGCNVELISWAKGRDTTASDPQVNPDTGQAYDAVIEFYNLFPCIDFYADIVFHYIGTIPAKVVDNPVIQWTGEETLLPDGSNGDWLKYLEDHGQMFTFLYHYASMGPPVKKGDQLHECDYLKLDVKIHVPQNNLFQNLSGTGYVHIAVVQWNDQCNGGAPDKVLNLPDPMSYVADCDYAGAPGPVYGTFFDAHLTGIPYDPDYNVWDDVWPSWCVDEGIAAFDGYVQLWDSYSSDPSFPYPDDDWDLVNYIINNYHVGDVTPTGTATMMRIQKAIWHFIDHGPWTGDNPVTDYIIADAIANGEGFIPQTGDDAAVLLWPVDEFGDDRYGQIVFIIVDP